MLPLLLLLGLGGMAMFLVSNHEALDRGLDNMFTLAGIGVFLFLLIIGASIASRIGMGLSGGGRR